MQSQPTTGKPLLLTQENVEFAFFEIENGKLISEKFEENLHAHHHEDGCRNHHHHHHAHDSNQNKHHHHAEILTQLSGVDKFYYYGMGMGLRNELTENHINFEKAKIGRAHV